METENTVVKYEYTKEDIVKKPETMKAVVIAISIDKGVKIFGNATQKPNKDYFQLLCENHDLGIRSNVHMSYFPNGKVPDNSKLAKYINKYEFLAVDQIIDLELNEKGFYDVVVE